MHVVSTTDLMPSDWNFLAGINLAPDLSFESFTGRVGTGWARWVPHPMAGRMQAAFRACQAAKKQPGAVLFSHLPLMGAATNVARKLTAPAVPQVAFSFNFTTLPSGARRKVMARAFKGISEFVVYSNYERGVYAELFDIPIQKLVYLPWAMTRPEPGPVNPMAGGGPYISAIGGEARDYASLAQAMRARPDLRAAVVARSYSLEGIDLPPNVTAFTDLPAPKTWALLAGSDAMVLPLRDGQTACGHITVVAAKLLGIPVIATDSVGIAEYVADGRVAALVPPGEPEAIVAAMAHVVGEPTARRAAAAAAERASAEHDPAMWLRYVAAKSVLLQKG
jgi:Glycosyl transferases group 1